MLLRSMKIPPEDVALAFTMQAGILELDFKESRHHRSNAANPGLTLEFLVLVHQGLGKISRKISACLSLGVWIYYIGITDIKVNRS